MTSRPLLIWALAHLEWQWWERLLLSDAFWDFVFERDERLPFDVCDARTRLVRKMLGKEKRAEMPQGGVR